MKRSGPIKSDPDKVRAWQRRSRKRLAAESPKRKAERPTRDGVRLEAHRLSGSRCQAVGLVEHVCVGPLDVHEIIPRSAWPGGQLVQANVVTICRAAHDWVGDHPAEAHAVGLHGYSWERPDR